MLVYQIPLNERVWIRNTYKPLAWLEWQALNLFFVPYAFHYRIHLSPFWYYILFKILLFSFTNRYQQNAWNYFQFPLKMNIDGDLIHDLFR